MEGFDRLGEDFDADPKVGGEDVDGTLTASQPEWSEVRPLWYPQYRMCADNPGRSSPGGLHFEGRVYRTRKIGSLRAVDFLIYFKVFWVVRGSEIATLKAWERIKACLGHWLGEERPGENYLPFRNERNPLQRNRTAPARGGPRN